MTGIHTLTAMPTNRKPAELKPSTLVARLNAQSDGNSFAFIYLTNECQLRCAHCSFQSGPGYSHTRIDGSLLLRAMEELKGIRDITISGGEPMLHPDFRTILHKAAQQARVVYVLSNGISLVGKNSITALARRNDLRGLKKKLRTALHDLPDHVHILFPLDTFHLRAFRRYDFFLKGLSAVVRERQRLCLKPALGFLSNEVSPRISDELIKRFSVASCTHRGTALFAPWRKSKTVQEWYYSHPLNRRPFAGGVYINYKGVYLNEASLLMDLREGIPTDLKIGMLSNAPGEHNQLERVYRGGLFF